MKEKKIDADDVGHLLDTGSAIHVFVYRVGGDEKSLTAYAYTPGVIGTYVLALREARAFMSGVRYVMPDPPEDNQ